MTTPSPQSDYKQEVRFAVVMYGGVSLAIYINGVAQELLRLVRSTAEPSSTQTNLTGTERIYREVSYLLANEESGAKEFEAAQPDAVPPTRFVVDILAGTSAGGINGIFLAKALANGQDMDRLKELWVQEGDIETLINDKLSIEKPLKLQNPPTSLLNSERMYLELLKAFDLMDESGPRRQQDDESPLVDELDLFVTSTDLEGVVLPISLSDSVVFEKRHRNVMHFVYSERKVSGDSTRNDFHKDFNPFLAYAARCTSSFPFAFEPMALTDIDRLLKRLPTYRNRPTINSANPDWRRLYHDYLDPRGLSTVPFPQRPFGDGGYLDNKPFSYATESLMNKTASVPVDRKLIYIEPSPEHPEVEVEKEGKPDAVENVIAALLTLPRYETIREDLQRVNERNRLISRVNAVTSGVDRDEDHVRIESKDFYDSATERWDYLGALATPDSKQLWSQDRLSDADHGKLDLTDVIKRKGRSYAAYLRLRISAVTDDVAKLITRIAGFDENSEYSIIIRSMVRAWRVKEYIEYRQSTEDHRPTVNQFLFEFDLSYPIRRVNYLRRKVDALYRFESDARTVINIQARKFGVTFEDPNVDPRLRDAFCQQVLDYKSELNGLFILLRLSARTLRSRHSTKTVSPLKEGVSNLVGEISKAVDSEVQKTAQKPESAVIDYFLGTRSSELTANQRSYKAASPEEQCVIRAQQFLEAHPEIMAKFEEVAQILREEVGEVKAETEQSIVGLFTATSAAPLDPDPNVDTIKWIAKYCIGHYYENYENYDQLTYPILYDTDVGEADNIDIIRISPEDATQLINERLTGCHKLAGTALGHFGAFLQKSWRQNDILWGRLDGAERIISALLPNHPKRADLIGRSQAQIIYEAISVLGEDEKHELLAEALMRTKSRKAEPELLDSFIKNLVDHCHSDPKLNGKLNDLIKAPNLRQFYVTNFRKRSKVDPETTLRSVARATDVVGKILDAISASRNVDTKFAKWISRLGQIFWALVQVAVPQSFANLIFRHWLKVVYFLEVLLIAGGALFSQAEMQQFGVTAFGITAAIHLTVMILGDLLKTRNRWLNVTIAILLLAGVSLVVIGVFTVSALFGVESTWKTLETVRDWINRPAPFGLNWRTVFRFGLLPAVLLMFLVSMSKDLKALFKSSPKASS